MNCPECNANLEPQDQYYTSHPNGALQLIGNAYYCESCHQPYYDKAGYGDYTLRTGRPQQKPRRTRHNRNMTRI